MRHLIRVLTVLGMLASSSVLAGTAEAVALPAHGPGAVRLATAPPVAVADTAEVGKGGSAEVALLANDTCGGVAPCLPSALAPTGGLVMADPVGGLPAGISYALARSTGILTVSASAGYAGGPVVLSYRLTDLDGATSDPASVTVTVVPSGVVARPDAVRVPLGGSGTVDLLANDTCQTTLRPCPASAARVRVVTSPLPYGVTTRVNATTKALTVTVTRGRIRDLTLRYEVRDSVGSATSTVTVLVRRRTFAPGRFTPPPGARFNIPTGSFSQRRAIIRNVVRTIDAVPGYRVDSRGQCPTKPALFPAEIKIALYSIADRSFVDALIRADRRCVSVQLLMNNHLDARTSPSWGALRHQVGGDRHARSFTYRCQGSCRGTAILHSKFYLFSRAGSARNVVMVGSSNMTSNATHVQWNDLYTVEGAPGSASAATSAGLYGQFRSVFEEMVPDRRLAHPLRQFRAGPYDTTFYPDPTATAADDPTMADLRSIRCNGATGGAGIDGHTLVLINIHAWHSARGAYIADQVRRLYARGCYVRILYSFMSHGVYKQLTANTGPRMMARRTIFPQRNGIVAALYSHMKSVAVSGVVGADTSAWVVWTGSNNFTNLGLHDDEVTIRIPFRSAFAAYRGHFDYIRIHKSAANWAIYEEPSGGGRARAATRFEALVDPQAARRAVARHVLTPETIRAPGEVH